MWDKWSDMQVLHALNAISCETKQVNSALHSLSLWIKFFFVFENAQESRHQQNNEKKKFALKNKRQFEQNIVC